MRISAPAGEGARPGPQTVGGAPAARRRRTSSTPTAATAATWSFPGPWQVSQPTAPSAQPSFGAFAGQRGGLLPRIGGLSEVGSATFLSPVTWQDAQTCT